MMDGNKQLMTFISMTSTMSKGVDDLDQKAQQRKQAESQRPSK